ncbi:IS66 family insertion sequence element accessory protein TnpB [Halomonas daqiaonensis]|uniref:IS66 family insertion sequence element accessory protein TnpB n=1 Tax=Halomonas daqiaonensis TaxID=650850 RepID=UPI003CC7A906
MVRRQLGKNPLSGHGFIFINRRRTQLKCLYFQAGGYCVWSKRLERGRFAAWSAPAGQRHRAALRCLGAVQGHRGGAGPSRGHEPG